MKAVSVLSSIRFLLVVTNGEIIQEFPASLSNTTVEGGSGKSVIVNTMVANNLGGNEYNFINI